MPDIYLLDLRAQKEFVIKHTQRLHLMFNVFNLTDAKIVSAVNQGTGPTFNSRVYRGGTVLRLGTRYTF